MIGENLEDYSIVAELSSHSAYRTFLGESIAGKVACKRVVIKMVSATRIPADQCEIQEILPLRQLHHPHILPILSAGTYKDTTLYLITEYMASGSLHSRLRRSATGQPMPQEEALSLLRQIGEALDYAHQQQVMHGSLTPRNVFFRTSGHVVVTDFRFADLLAFADADATGPSELSIYLAPEQLASGHASQKSDQYALGCLAYEMFTGLKAFMIPSVNTPGRYYRTKSLITPGQLNPALPGHIDAAILKAMSRDPAQRYDTIPDFLTALNRVAVETDAMAGPVHKEDITEDAPLLEEATEGIPLLIAADDPSQSPTAEARPVEVPLRSSLSGRFLGRKTPRTLMFGRSRNLMVTLGLIVLVIGIISLLLPFWLSTPIEKLNATPSARRTAIIYAPTPTHVPATTASTSSSTPVVTATPQSTGSLPNGYPDPTPTVVPTPSPTSGPTPTPAMTQIQVQLNAFFNNDAIGNAPGEADFDGSGYSYPASQLPASGSVTVNGVPYLFPGSSPGTPDNIVAAGQVISLTPGSYREACLLVAASWGPVTGSLAVSYTDGSSATTNVTVTDWFVSQPNSLHAPYRYTPTGKDAHTIYIYAVTVALDPTRTASALVLPGWLSGPYQNSRFHVFALTLMP